MKKIINFACKKISLIELFTCSFNISKTDYIVLNYLLKSKNEKTISEISKAIKKERSTVQKAIYNLIKRGLVKRRQMNLTAGGYSYYYSPLDKEEIKKRMLKLVKDWSLSVSKSIENMSTQ